MLRNLGFIMFTKGYGSKYVNKQSHGMIRTLEKQLWQCLGKDSQFSMEHMK